MATVRKAKNTQEVGIAIKLAGATQVRKTVGERKLRMYVLPAGEDEVAGGPEVLIISESFSVIPAYPVQNPRIPVFVVYE
jgi:hypothetical protein